MSVKDEDTPHYHSHRYRLRARFMETSGDPLPDYELLELLLFRSVPRRDVKPIAKQLSKRFGTFAEVLAAPPNRLMEVDGVGESMVTDLKVVEAAARRIAKGAVYRLRLVRHRIACYAARAASESWFCRTAAGVWNPCRSMSQVVL